MQRNLFYRPLLLWAQHMREPIDQRSVRDPSEIRQRSVRDPSDRRNMFTERPTEQKVLDQRAIGRQKFSTRGLSDLTEFEAGMAWSELHVRHSLKQFQPFQNLYFFSKPQDDLANAVGR